MKIGIYKPYKKILFDDELDTNSWSRELVNLAKIFASHDNQVYICSDTDYKNDIQNICVSSYADSQLWDFDVLFISNGVFDKNKYSEKEIIKKAQDDGTKKTILLDTDLSLSDKYHTASNYDTIWSQRKDHGLKIKYAHLEKLFLYKHPTHADGYEARNRRGIFVGYERNRLEKILEFVVRPLVDWYGKSTTFNFKNRPFKSEVSRLLRKYMFSVVISGELQNVRGYISQRYYENAIHGIINFVDIEFDKDELMLKMSDPRRIKDYIDLYSKVMNMNKKQFLKLQQSQFDEIKPWIDGEKLYHKFMELLSNDAA